MYTLTQRHGDLIVTLVSGILIVIKVNQEGKVVIHSRCKQLDGLVQLISVSTSSRLSSATLLLSLIPIGAL